MRSLIAVILATYAVPALVGGNGYISAYLAGILLGNQTLPRKKNLVHFFDAWDDADAYLFPAGAIGISFTAAKRFFALAFYRAVFDICGKAPFGMLLDDTV